MDLLKTSSATDKDGFFLDKTVYVAILAKVKAQLHKDPNTFATFKQLMIQYCQRARNNDWDDVQIVVESNKLQTTLESMFPHHMPEFQLIFIRGTSQQLRLNESEKNCILDFLNELKANCAAEILDFPLAVLGNPWMRYNAFINLMQEYLDNLIDYRIFLCRGLDLCDGVSSNVSLQRQFVGQFCADIDIEDCNRVISMAPDLSSLGTNVPV